MLAAGGNPNFLTGLHLHCHTPPEALANFTSDFVHDLLNWLSVRHIAYHHVIQGSLMDLKLPDTLLAVEHVAKELAMDDISARCPDQVATSAKKSLDHG